MSSNNNWRGRGGGRGRGGNQGNRNYNDQNNMHDNVPITSRLGPHNNTGGGSNIASRLGPTNGPTDNFNDNRNQNNNQRGGSRAFNNSNYRGRGRGGQGGNRTRFTRGFADEDISMQTDGPKGIIVKVSGFPKGSEEKVIGFLTRKSKTVWEPLHVEYGNNYMNITVADDAAADSLCRINNFNFGNATLQVARADGDGTASSYSNTQTTTRSTNRSGSRSAVLEEFVKERWTAQSGLLNMEELPNTSHKISTVIERLLEEAQRLFGEAVISISFARNKLWSVAPIAKLGNYFPNLLNLSLQDNDIAEVRSLDKLANKLPMLNEIVLLGNPVQSNTDQFTFYSEVLKRFPSLHYIDFQDVSGSGGAQPPVQLPVPVRRNFFDNDVSSMTCQELLSKFFPLFDTNRSSLLALYDPQSVFSCVFSNNGTFQQQNNWGVPQGSTSQRLVIGSENIIKRLVTLPPTQHDISNADNFITDAWQSPGHQNYSVFLQLVVHGEFVDTSSGAPLSFDRTFIVAPSIPGSSAQSAGWGYVILSDSLIVRNYSCKPGSLVTAS